MSVPTKQEWQRAYHAGEGARRAGRKRDRVPMYGMGEIGRTLREAWLQGWDKANEDRKR